MLVLAAMVLYCCHHLAWADNCQSFFDISGNPSRGFDCVQGLFCCGDCVWRYCCSSHSDVISDAAQNDCIGNIPSGTIVAGIVIGVIAAFVICITTAWMVYNCWQRRRRFQTTTPDSSLEQARGTETANRSPRSDTEIPHIQDGVPPPSQSQGHDRVRERDKRERAGPWGPISSLTMTALP
uniref:protein shisa-4-like n=1 Tax=Myxine glutinosa TaxID=7769 RepID=UPI00358E4F8C